MAVVSGDLRLVTNQAARASEVIVRARDLHTQAGAVVLTAGDRVPVSDGRVSFTALPGPAVMVVVVDGRPTESVPLLVPDGDIGLADAVAAALALDDATFSELEALAVRVAAGVAGVETDLGSVRELKAAAEAAAASAGSSASTATAAAQAAESARDAAAGSASTASQAAQAARESQNAAAVSAGSASSSASAAAGSASAARNSQTVASSAQQAAVASQQAAAASASAAKESEGAAAASAAQAAEVAATGVPDATGDAKGKLRLAGDLGGTADAPTVPGLAGKASASHTHTQAEVTGLSSALDGKANTGHTHTLTQITNAPNSHSATPTALSLMSRDSAGRSQVNAPSAANDIANKSYVDNAVAGVSVDTSGLVQQSEVSTSGTANTVVKRTTQGFIESAQNPWHASHVTTKQYVDNTVSSPSVTTRNISAGGGTIYLRKAGGVVHINIVNVSNTTNVNIPTGFRPAQEIIFMGYTVYSILTPVKFTLATNGNLSIETNASSVQTYVSTAYVV